MTVETIQEGLVLFRAQLKECLDQLVDLEFNDDELDLIDAHMRTVGDSVSRLADYLVELREKRTNEPEPGEDKIEPLPFVEAVDNGYFEAPVD